MTPRYRAWHKTWEELGEVRRIRFDDEGDVCTVLFRGKILGTDTPIDKIELMQSTGLRDYFGEELFEGDVIEWSYWDEFEDSGTAKIIFDKGVFKLLDVRTEKSVWDNLFDCIENCNVFLQGNIYENREFLEAIKCTQK